MDDVTEVELRQYERAGLLQSRSRHQSVQLSDREILRVSLVRKGIALGFTISQLKELIDGYYRTRKIE